MPGLLPGQVPLPAPAGHVLVSMLRGRVALGRRAIGLRRISASLVALRVCLLWDCLYCTVSVGPCGRGVWGP